MAPAVTASAKDKKQHGRTKTKTTSTKSPSSSKKTRPRNKARDKAAATKATSFEIPPTEIRLDVPLESLVRSQYQVRGEDGDPAYSGESIGLLADSIEAKGLKQNLVGVDRPDGTIAIHAGGRRLRALQLLKERGGEVPPIHVKIESENEAEVTVDSLLENLQREDMAKHQEARAVQLIISYDDQRGATARLAKRIGRSQRWVQQRLALANLTDVAMKLFIEGRLTFEDARDLSRWSPETQAVAIARLLRWNETQGFTDHVITPRGVSLRHVLGVFCGQVEGVGNESDDTPLRDELPLDVASLEDDWFSGHEKGISLLTVAEPFAAAATPNIHSIVDEDGFLLASTEAAKDFAVDLKVRLQEQRKKSKSKKRKIPTIHVGDDEVPEHLQYYAWQHRFQGDWVNADNITIRLKAMWAEAPNVPRRAYSRQQRRYYLEIQAWKKRVEKKSADDTTNAPKNPPKPGSPSATGIKGTHLKMARRMRTSALRAALRRDEATALRLLLLALLTEQGGVGDYRDLIPISRDLPHTFSGNHPLDGDPEQSERIIAEIPDAGLKLDKAKFPSTARGTNPQRKLYAALCEIAPAKLLHHLADVFTNYVGVHFNGFDQDRLGDNPLACAITSSLSLEHAMPDGWKWTDDWLCGYDKATMVALGVDSGAISKDDVETLSTKTAKQIRKIILDGKPPKKGWTPPELRYNTLSALQVEMDKLRARYALP